MNKEILSGSFLAHDSGMSVIKNGELTKTIIFERLTREKHDGGFLIDSFLSELSKTELDSVSFSQFLKHDNDDHIHAIKKEVKDALDREVNLDIQYSDHHLCHAYCGYYTSKFDDALCIVMDGNGSAFKDKMITEIESVYTFRNHKFNKVISKKYISVDNFKKIYHKINNLKIDWSCVNVEDIIKILDEDISMGQAYEDLCILMGMSGHDAGKLMGLSQYKNHKSKLPEGYNSLEWINKVDASYIVQKKLEDRVFNIVEEHIDKTGIKNVILTGGIFLNCVSNYNLVKKFPDLNIHVDPMCSDNGISIGNALISYTKKYGESPTRIEGSYHGSSEPLNEIKSFGCSYKTNITYSDVVDLLINGEIVALYQGKSEVGQRSLGNRSLLFDPRVSNGKTIVNKIKRRENYRPFAASILLEYSHDWFDLKTLNESPTMSYALEAKQRSLEQVPSVIHVDGTSRIQTVTEKQNYHFYNLIHEFYKKTNVPMLLNTSFNLAGEPLVETIQDAVNVMHRSDLKYVYLPEINLLLFK